MRAEKTARQKVAILGATGMLGSAIYNALKDHCSLVVTYRNPRKLELLYQRYGRSKDNQAVQFDFTDLSADYRAGFAGKVVGPSLKRLLDQIGSVDWVINTMGVTKALSKADPGGTVFLNGAVPHILAAHFGDRLIQITTDCVFDGKEGAPYTEDSPKHPVDLYGLSKAIGEPTSALVLRISTIGPELGTRHGLLEWFMSQTSPVQGFTNHLWNGITTKQFGIICDKLISGEVKYPGSGIYHIFSSAVTKYEMLLKFKERFGTAAEVEPFEAPVAIDRRLSTVKALNGQLNLPSFEEMVKEL